MKKYLVLTALLTSPSFATPPSDLLKCSAIKGGVERLECFDNLANNGQKAADISAEKKLGGGKISKNWTTNISQSKIDDSQIVVLSTDATEYVLDRSYKKATPNLFLRCKENVTVMYIHFDGMFMSDISGNGKVTFRIDKDASFSQNLNVSSGNKALGLFNGGTAIPFIKKLMTGATLIVQATPFNDSPIIVTFDISGLEAQIEPLRRACKW